MLELKQAEFDLIKCQSAKMEIELRILKLEEDIKRNRKHLELQNELEKKHKDKIKELKGE